MSDGCSEWPWVSLDPEQVLRTGRDMSRRPSHRARSDSPRPWCSRGHERQMHSHDDKERHMKMLSTTVLMGALAGAVLLLTSSTAGAQSKTLEGESETGKVTIEAIDQVSTAT